MGISLFSTLRILPKISVLLPLLAVGQENINFLLITADDMNHNSPGIYGCRIPDITPNIDQLAQEGIRFNNAHVNSSVCMPSRMSILTGMYPHANGAVGFIPVDPDVVTLTEVLRKHGYLNGVMGKDVHNLPIGKYQWDFFIGSRSHLNKGRDPEKYYKCSKEFFLKARDGGKPFFLMANSDDPHDPFAGGEREQFLAKNGIGVNPFTRRILPDEVDVPPYLPNIPGVRDDLAAYYTSVHRCDQTVGEILRALKESGMDKNTVVIFLSDNGIEFLFAKSTCYPEGTKTPFIVRWPDVIEPGSIDNTHLISGVDIMPTILEIAGINEPLRMNGNTFLPLLKGESQVGREYVFTEFTDAGGFSFHPEHIAYSIRAVTSKDYVFIINYWANGVRSFKGGWNHSTSTLYWKREIAFKADKGLLERLLYYFYRVPEEFFDLKADPYCMNNLANNPDYKDMIEEYRKVMIQRMKNTNDPALKATKRGTAKAYEEFTLKQKSRADQTPERTTRIESMFPFVAPNQ